MSAFAWVAVIVGIYHESNVDPGLKARIHGNY